MKKLYYYVPPCPKCKSRKTGRLEFVVFSDKDQYKEECVRHGELVKFCDLKERNSAFCAECGYEWPAKVEVRRLTPDEIEAEKTARETRSLHGRLVVERMRNPEKKKDSFLKRLIGV